jgi:hypothetical protein
MVLVKHRFDEMNTENLENVKTYSTFSPSGTKWDRDWIDEAVRATLNSICEKLGIPVAEREQSLREP